MQRANCGITAGEAEAQDQDISEEPGAERVKYRQRRDPLLNKNCLVGCHYSAHARRMTIAVLGMWFRNVVR